MPAPPKCFRVILGTIPKPYRLMFHISQVTPAPSYREWLLTFALVFFGIYAFAFPVLFYFFSLFFTLSLTLILSPELVQYLSSGIHLAILATQKPISIEHSMTSSYSTLLLDAQRYAPTCLRPTTDPRRRSPMSPEYSPRSPPHSSRSPRYSPKSPGIVSRPQYTSPEDTTSGMEAVVPIYQLVNSLKQRQKQITKQIKKLEQEHANIDGMLNDLTGESVPRYMLNPASKRPAAGTPTTTEPSSPKEIALGTTLPCYTPASPPRSPAKSARKRPATAFPNDR